MSRQVRFVTPENIEVSYEIAGIGSRYMAAVVDHLLQLAIILLIAWAASLVSVTASVFNSADLPIYVQAISGLVIFAVIFGYFVLFELLGGGRTPGKRLTGLRVVRDGGYPIDLYASIVRNLVRIVDFLPFAYGVGLGSIFLSPDYKRLGDYAAGTLVIKDRSADTLRIRTVREHSPLVAQFLPFVRNVDQLTLEEFHAIRRFVDRRHELQPAIQAHIAHRLASPIITRLGIEAPLVSAYQLADLLEAIELKFVEERGLL